GGDEISQAVDQQDAGDAHVVIEEADKGAGEQHAALHADQHGGVGTGELAGRHDFLDERVDVGPVDGRAGAGQKCHQVQVPDLQVAAPCHVGDAQNGQASGQTEQHAEVTAIHAID